MGAHPKTAFREGRDFRPHGRIRLGALQNSFARSLAAREGLAGGGRIITRDGQSGSACDLCLAPSQYQTAVSERIARFHCTEWV